MIANLSIPRQWQDVTIIQKMALWQAPLIFILALEIGHFMWLFWLSAWLMSFLRRWWMQLPLLSAMIAMTAQLVPIKSADFFILMLVILLPFTWRLDEADSGNPSHISPAGLCPTIFLAGSVFIFQSQFIILLGLVAWLLSFLLWFTSALTGFRLSSISVRWVPIIAGSAVTAAMIVTLFTFIPRLSTGFIPSFATAQQKIGLTDTLEPGGMSDLLASQEVAFRAIPANLEQAAPRYWRVFVLTEQKGNSWQRRRVAGIENDFVLRGDDSEVKYQILTDNHDLTTVPIAGWPASSASATASGYGYNQHGEAMLDRGKDTRQVWINAIDSDSHDYDYTSSTDLSGANPRLQEYAKTLRAKFTDDDAFISAVMSKFGDEFLYDTSVSYPNKDALDSFYFETKIGYCSYFATTLATILRAGGIEAHVVTGYMGGEWNAFGNYWLVKQSDAHAWVEVKRPDGSWQRLDPTLEAMQLSTARFQGLAAFGETEFSGRPITTVTEEGFLKRLSSIVAFADSLNLRVTLAIMNYGDEASNTDNTRSDEDNFALLLAAMGLAVTILFAVIGVIRLLGQQTNARPKSEKRLERLINTYAPARLSGESLIEHAHKLVSIDKECAELATNIARQIYTQRFSDHITQPHHDSQMQRDIRSLRDKLKSTKKVVRS